jgi:cytochrome c553/nitrate/TMAO reductase-like tetraheme cytochrome c subunit
LDSAHGIHAAWLAGNDRLEAPGVLMEKAMPKHIARLLILIAVIAIGAYASRTFLIPESFYQYGHYRGAAVAEIASKVPKLQGSASCQPCHKAAYAEWTAGIHRKSTMHDVVQGVVNKYGPNCEVCHTGPAGNHPSKEAMPLSIEDRITSVTHLERTVHPANVPGRNLLLSPEDMRGICLNCHEKLEARPTEQRQIEVSTHSGAELCVKCHNPHSPRIVFANLPIGPRGDAKVGKTVAALCIPCHGENGMSVNPAWPNLAGQHADFLVASLKEFKTGIRKNELMSPMVASLNEIDIRNVAAYFSKTKCGVTGGDKAKAILGKAKAANCAACHSVGGLYGPGAIGVSGTPTWPNLAGQNADYLANTLKSYQDGGRTHAVMTSVAKTLNADDIDNLSAYYASMSCK